MAESAKRALVALLSRAIDECDTGDPAMASRIVVLGDERFALLNPTAATTGRARRAARSDISWADLLGGRLSSARRNGGSTRAKYDDESDDSDEPRLSAVVARRRK